MATVQRLLVAPLPLALLISWWQMRFAHALFMCRVPVLSVEIMYLDHLVKHNISDYKVYTYIIMIQCTPLAGHETEKRKANQKISGGHLIKLI